MDTKNWVVEAATDLDSKIVMYKSEDNSVQLIVLEKADNGKWYLWHEYFDYDDIDREDFEEWLGSCAEDYAIEEEYIIEYLCARGSSIISYYDTEKVVFKNLGLEKIYEYTGVDLVPEHGQAVHISDYRDWLIEEYVFDNRTSIDLLDGLIEYCQRKGDEGEEMFKTIIENVLDTEDYDNLRKMDLMF